MITGDNEEPLLHVKAGIEKQIPQIFCSEIEAFDLRLIDNVS
jgi:hypothetical protein